MLNMTKQQQLYVWAGVAIVVLASLVWWRTTLPTRSTDTSQPKIGGLFALTGYASFAGEASRDGFIMATEDSEMDVDYVIEDFQSDFTTVATAATKLTNVDQVPVVIGPEWHEFSEIITPISAANKVVFISPWMTGEGKVFDSDYYFSGTPSDREQTRRLLQYMDSQNHRRIVLVYSNNAWADGYVKVIKDEIPKTNIQILEEFKFNENSNDFRTELARIKQINPDAVYTVIASDNHEGLFNKQFKELALTYPHYMPHARAESSVFLEQFGPYVNGIVYSAPGEYKNAAEFREKYKARFGKEPGAISAATSYDMTTLVLDAMKNGARTADEIRDYLLKVKRYDGYSNLINFDGKHQITGGKVLIKEISGHTPKILAD